jgi:hypothetical protein
MQSAIAQLIVVCKIIAF